MKTTKKTRPITRIAALEREVKQLKEKLAGIPEAQTLFEKAAVQFNNILNSMAPTLEALIRAKSYQHQTITCVPDVMRIATSEPFDKLALAEFLKGCRIYDVLETDQLRSVVSNTQDDEDESPYFNTLNILAEAFPDFSMALITGFESKATTLTFLFYNTQFISASRIRKMYADYNVIA